MTAAQFIDAAKAALGDVMTIEEREPTIAREDK